jgi:hypothetical protein
MIHKDGLKISHNKTYYSRHPIVTGVIPMNNYLRLQESFTDKLKNKSGKTEKQIKGLSLYKQKVDKINGKVLAKNE